MPVEPSRKAGEALLLTRATGAIDLAHAPRLTGRRRA